MCGPVDGLGRICYLLVTHVIVYRTIYEAHHPSLVLGGVQTAAPSTIGIS